MRPIPVLFNLLFLCCGLQAQTNRIISPEVTLDHQVTFRLLAPKAAAVTFNVDWMRPGTQEKMTRDTNGLWSATLGPVQPGVYIYSFTVDGLTVADPVNPRIKLRARTSASLLEVPGSQPELWEARDVPHGTVEIQYHKSNTLLGETRQVWIYKPPGYDQNRSTRYPVLYLLHGNNDTAAGWSTVGRANYILDNLIADKKARPMILVMPFGHAVAIDAPREQQQNNTRLFEQYLLEDLRPMIEKQYRVASGRENRAIAGLSMGGGQALQIGLRHLDLFSAVGGFSSAVPNDFENQFAPLLSDAKGTNKKLQTFWIGCGRGDAMYGLTEKLSTVLSAHRIEHTFRTVEGGHTFTVWRQCLGEMGPLLFQKSKR